MTGSIAYATTIMSAGDISYDNATSGIEATNVQDAVDELLDKAANGAGGIKFKIGDYVQMTPTKTSYTTDTTKTGYTEAQTINPSELNLWRIINANSNGTYDAVSEYVSSTKVYFSGETGYKNFVGYLNTLASQYGNDSYTTGSRYMGYNGQTEFMTTILSTSTAGTSATPALSDSVGQEYNSGARGDTLYAKDYNLVNNALGTLVAKDVSDKSTAKTYWMASRWYSYRNSDDSYYWCGRYIATNGGLTGDSLRYNYSHRGLEDGSLSYSLRPIITLNSMFQGSGTGTSDDPYVLS